MDYKRIFRSAEGRSTVLNILRFVPDKTMLRLQYWIKTGRKLNLKNPQRFTEKIQWYKLNYKNPLMRQCVDKFAVRNYVKQKGLGNILIELYAKYNSMNEMVLENLPNSFVIKTTNGGGGLNVFICSDKTKLNINNLKKSLVGKSKVIKSRTGGREWAYYGLSASIIVEKLLVNEKNPESGINDYKIFCYEGKAKYIIVDIDRYIGHKRNFYDKEWNNLHVTSDCPASDEEIAKPKNYKEMIQVAEKLASDFPYVRVDLYNINGKIYFGELTFYPWSGYVQFNPDKFDYLFGKDFELVKYIRRNNINGQ